MKVKFAALIILGVFLMAMSTPVTAIPEIDTAGIKAQIKDKAMAAICTACQTACATVAEKCYAQFQEGTKGVELCEKIETACFDKCPCE